MQIVKPPVQSKRRLRGALSVCLLLLSGSVLSSEAESIAVIVNENNLQIVDAQFIKDVYSDQVKSWNDGASIHINELPTLSSTRDRFYREFLGISARKSDLVWSNRKVSNQLNNLAPTVRRESRLISAVANDQQAIGYVSEAALQATNAPVRVIYRIE